MGVGAGVRRGLRIIIGPPLETYAEARIQTVGAPDGLAMLGLWLSGWYWLPALGAILVFVPLVFPDGRWPGPRWRVFGWLVVVLWGLVALVGMVAGTLAPSTTSLWLRDEVEREAVEVNLPATVRTVLAPAAPSLWTPRRSP